MARTSKIVCALACMVCGDTVANMSAIANDKVLATLAYTEIRGKIADMSDFIMGLLPTAWPTLGKNKFSLFGEKWHTYTIFLPFCQSEGVEEKLIVLRCQMRY